MKKPNSNASPGTAGAQHSGSAALIGLGYVGLPLATAAARRGITTLRFDFDPAKIAQLNDDHSYLEAVASAELLSLVETGPFSATTDFERLAECDVIVIGRTTPSTSIASPIFPT